MPDIAFDSSGHARFPTKYHGEVVLSKNKWDKVCQAPERWYYHNNGEKVATTLINPDYVRSHATYPNQFLYYKAFTSFTIRDGVEVSTGNPYPPYFAVVIDISTKKVCTVYPTEKPKLGKEYRGT
jgi:hypothetical protein